MQSPVSPELELVRPASMPCLPTLLAASSSSNLAGAVVVGLQPPRLRRSVSLSELDVETFQLPIADESDEEKGSDVREEEAQEERKDMQGVAEVAEVGEVEPQSAPGVVSGVG